MQVSLVITILGPDRRGLVKSLSKTLSQFQGSWTESRMSRLAGKFAGILKVSVPAGQHEPLAKALKALQTESFNIHVETVHTDSSLPLTKNLKLELLGQDRPSIIHDITKQLEHLNVNIEELESEVIEASMSGGILFFANLTLGLPEDLTADEVQNSLEALSDDFMVNINVS